MVSGSDCTPKKFDSAAKSNQLALHLVLYKKKSKKRRKENVHEDLV